VTIEADPNAALFHAAEGNFDLLIVSLGLENFDALRLCSQLRSLDRTRNIPILAIADADNTTRLVRGLEIGVNDYLTRPIDKNELMARVRTQVRKKRYTERLRDNVQISIEMAITDPLTGLYNRRYMESHIGTLVEQAAARGKPLTVLVLDIDYFKAINDTHGHDAGDDVLREFATRIRKSIRGIDRCRYGGEEFVVVMPETDMAVATVVERLRRRIASDRSRSSRVRARSTSPSRSGLPLGSDKKRFALSEDGTRIRASQGHSVEVELGYEPATPPEVPARRLRHKKARRLRRKSDGQP
jgi:two-component system cell cycle response regulator